MREISLIALLGFSGAAGAIARYFVSQWANPWTESVPCGTLIVNVLGCFLLGALACATGLNQSQFSPQFKLAIGTGFLGSFTTFSTFGVETYQRFENGNAGFALANIGLNIILGLAAVWCGFLLATWWFATPTT